MQIGDENVHRVRALMDEIFGDENLISEIVFSKTVCQTAVFLPASQIIVFGMGKTAITQSFRPLVKIKSLGGEGTTGYRFLEIFAFEWRALTQEEKSGVSAPTSGR